MAELFPGRRDPWTEPPMGLLAELTHRCPLQCPYCSNPLELERVNGELATADWCRVLDEAADLGVLQVHLSGGEPTAARRSRGDPGPRSRRSASTPTSSRPACCSTSGASRAAGGRPGACAIQPPGRRAPVADRVGGYRGGHAKKLRGTLVRAAGLPLTINAVVHRQNLDQLEAMIGLRVELGAHRLEVAHVQYYGWALRNRAALMPTREQLEAAPRSSTLRARELGQTRDRLRDSRLLGETAQALHGRLGQHDPQRHAARQGDALPRRRHHPGPRASPRSATPLRWIWQESRTFQRFRGTGWMPDPCRSCTLKEVDFGGCRCQAMALAGDAAATDPACELSPLHAAMFGVAACGIGSTAARVRLPAATSRGPGTAAGAADGRRRLLRSRQATDVRTRAISGAPLLPSR